jgi:glucosamine-phosphate N-acetyltransferase
MNLMEIRSYTFDDLDRICRLLGQLWPGVAVNTPAMRECFASGLRSASQRYICAVVGGEVVGFCSLNVRNSLWQQGLIGHVDELVVDGRHRRIGVGSALLRRIEELAAEMGCKRLELDSAHHRVEAHAFYEGLGFENRALLFSKNLDNNPEGRARPAQKGAGHGKRFP